jgi:ribosomal protein L27
VRLTIKAWVGNTHTLYVGGSTVTATSRARRRRGFQLSPGEAVTFGVDDVSTVYIHGTAAEGASFFYET